jgi:hypothetical protein
MLRDGPAAESWLCGNGNGGSAVPLVDGKGASRGYGLENGEQKSMISC